MQHKFKLAILLSVVCVNAFATPVYQPPGHNLTYGSSSNNQSIMSSVANPAAAAAILSKDGGQFRFGLIEIGAGYEVGNLNDLSTKVDNSKSTITNPISPADAITLANKYLTDCPTLTCTPAQLIAFSNDVATTINNNAAVATLNNVLLPALQKDGNASVYGDAYVPFTPFVVSSKGLGGSIVLNANVSAIVNASFIADPFFISPTTATAIANAFTTAASTQGTTNPTYTLPTIPNDSTVLLKGAVVEEIGLGYSRAVLRREAPEPGENEPTPGAMSASQLKAGELTAGVRLKYYQVKLADKAQSLTQSQSGTKGTLKTKLVYASSSGFGLDVGTLWTSKRYRAGAWINNINSPSFKYNPIDTTSYKNQTVIAQLGTGMTYTMKPQLQLEGAVFSESQNWVVNAGLDANAVQDPVGRDFQWMTLSAAYATNRWWVPGARVGYRSNLAGSKLSYITGGLTWFGVSLDIAKSLDSVHDNKGKSIPRSAMINLGFQMTF